MTVERLRLLLADAPPGAKVLVAGPGGAYEVLSLTHPTPLNQLVFIEVERLERLPKVTTRRRPATP